MVEIFLASNSFSEIFLTVVSSSGLVSDRYGRKVAIWASSVTMVVFGVVTSFVPW